MKKIILVCFIGSLMALPSFAGPFDDKNTAKINQTVEFDSMKSLIQWISSQKKGIFKKTNFDEAISANIDLAKCYADLIYLASKTTDKDLKDRLVRLAAAKAQTPSEIRIATKLVATRSGAGAFKDDLVLEWAKTQARDLDDVVELVTYYRTILLEQRGEMDHRLLEIGVRYVRTQTDVDRLLGLQTYSLRRAALLNLLKGQIKQAGLEGITLPRK